MPSAFAGRLQLLLALSVYQRWPSISVSSTHFETFKPTTQVFDYPTSRDIGEFLAAAHPGAFAAPAALAAVAPTAPPPRPLAAPAGALPVREAVAIVAAAYRVAGGDLDNPASGALLPHLSLALCYACLAIPFYSCCPLQYGRLQRFLPLHALAQHYEPPKADC